MDAIIDIGSNSVRLCIDRGKAVNQKILNTTQLAENLALTGSLDDRAIVRTAKAVADFFHTAKDQGADNVYVFGTEAVRSAGGEKLKAMIENSIPVKVDVISGEKEALLGFMAAADATCRSAVLDIGGASVELTCGDKDGVSYAKSLKLGVVRTRDAVGSARADIEKFYAEKIVEYEKVCADKLIGIGGTATSLASMLLNQTKYSDESVHGFVITRTALESLIDVIFSCNDLCARFPSIDKKRAGVIMHGAILTLQMLDYLGFDSVTVSARDNIEGYLMSLQNITANV